MGKESKKKENPSLAVNRRALHDYFVEERYEAGIELVGTEVKVVRHGEAGLVGAYCQIKNGEIFICQLRIPPYAFGNRFNHDSLRTRRLLLHKKEILKLQQHSEQKGMTLIPLKLYLTAKGRVKVEIGVCRGKAQYDKRETIKRREADRDARRAIMRH